MSRVWTHPLADATPVGGIAGLVGGAGVFRTMFGGDTASFSDRATLSGLGHPATQQPRVDPVEEAAKAAFVDGFREGERTALEQATADDHARLRLADAIALLAMAQDGALASALSVAVVRLVKQIMGEVAIDSETLQARCAAVAASIEADHAAHPLEVHPDDLPLIDAQSLGVTLVPNPSLTRGSVQIATSDGWVEDGPDVRLARLIALLDDMEGQP